jgi:hypothetical protein
MARTQRKPPKTAGSYSDCLSGQSTLLCYVRGPAGIIVELAEKIG